MKCNVDAAIFKWKHLTGSAAVIRDSNDGFMVCKMQKYQGLLEVHEAEVKALLDALTWAISMNLHQVIFETEAKYAVEVVYSKSVDQREFCIIIADCCSLQLYYNIQFTYRQVNMVANTLC